MMNKNTFPVFLMALLPVSALAQNRNGGTNATVVVVNNYEVSVEPGFKPSDEVYVPEDFTAFEKSFDYEEFIKTGYNSKAGFDPYHTDLKFDGKAFDGKRFYLKAGAGYEFAPVLETYYLLNPSKAFKLGLHANHDSYVGTLGNSLLKEAGSSSRFGYESNTVAGFDARYDKGANIFKMVIDYEGFHFGDSFKTPDGQSSPVLSKRSYNGLNAEMSYVNNMSGSWSAWSGGFDLGYSLGGNKTTFVDALTYLEHDGRARFYLARDFNHRHGFDVEGRVNLTVSSPMISAGGKGYFGVSGTFLPKYRFRAKRVSLDAGAGFMFSGGENVDNTRLFDVWPYLDFKWSAVPEHLDVFANANLTSNVLGARQQSMLFGFNIPYLSDENLSAIFKKFDTNLGLRGQIKKDFSYSLKAGFDMIENDPCFLADPSAMSVSLISQELIEAYAVIGLAYEKSFRKSYFKAECNAHYNYALNIMDVSCVPPAFGADLELSYSYMKRFGVHLGGMCASPYISGDYKTPWQIDLHLGGEYKFNYHTTLFLEVDNLLCRKNEIIPLYARNGLSARLGLILNL